MRVSLTPLQASMGLAYRGLRTLRPAQRVLSTRAEDVKPAAPQKPAPLAGIAAKPAPLAGIAAAADAVARNRAKGATWGQATQEGVITYRQGKMDASFKQFVDHALALPKYDLISGFKSNIEQSLKMTALEKVREWMPWTKKDPNKAELEAQLRIMEQMAPIDVLFPLKLGVARKQEIAIAAGTTPGAVGKMIRHFMQARAIHDFIHARERWNKPMPNDTEELFRLMRVTPSPRGFELMAEANQKRHTKRRRLVNFQRQHFKRGH